MYTRNAKRNLTDLLGSGFVADGRLEMERRSTGAGGVASAADENSETGLLEYGRVVVVGIAHRPAAGVFRRPLATRFVRSPTVAVDQRLKRIVLARFQLQTASVI